MQAFASPSAGTLFVFGFSCGLPFFLVGQTLATRLREAGIDLGAIGLISYAGFFYVLKFLWAPALDHWRIPGFAARGRRRGWLLCAQLVLCLSVAALALVDPRTHLPLVIALTALAALAGATQDAVVDAYRIEVAPLAAQGALITTYSLGYRLGLILGGAGALYVADFFSWGTAYAVMAGLLLLPIAMNWRAVEPVRPDQVSSMAPVSLWLPLRDFFARHGWVLGLGILLFVGCYKFPDQMLGVIAAPFYLDSGFGKSEIATVSKLYGVWIGLMGVLVGGIATAAVPLRHALLAAAVAVAASNLLFVLMVAHPGAHWAFVVTISGDNFAQGFAGTVLVAYLSSLTQQAHTATQYALLSSLANLPGKLVGGLSGFMVQQWGYAAFFVASACSILPTLLLLAWLWPRLPGHKNADLTRT